MNDYKYEHDAGLYPDFRYSVDLRIDRHTSNIYNVNNSGTNDLLELEVLRIVLIFTECNIVCVRFPARQGETIGMFDKSYP